MQEVIDPQLLKAFEWTFEDFEDHFDISFEFPEGFNEDLLRVELTCNNKCIYIGVTKQPPFFAGKFYNTVKNYTKVQSKSKNIHRFTKETNEEWPLPILEESEDQKLMDPQSCFNAFLYFQNLATQVTAEDKQQELLGMAQVLLQRSADTLYPPAVATISKIMLGQGNQMMLSQARALLAHTVELFKDPQCAFVLGLLLSQTGDLDEALAYLHIGAEAGIIDAINAMAEILSPVHEPHYSKENGENAFKLFETILQVQPDYFFALVGIAKHYAAGVGCKQDIEKAKTLLQKARELDSSFEFFDPEAVAAEYAAKAAEESAKTQESVKEKPQDDGIAKLLVAGGITAGFAAVVGIFLYRAFRK